jgi:RNA polymerase sigma-70 factor (ECF subfamily)
MPPQEFYCPPQRGLETWVGCRAEFEEVVARNMPRLCQMARRCLRNREDAEDAVQDAVMLAFRHVNQFEGRARMSSWLTAILLNAVRTQIRRRPRYALLSLDQCSEEDGSTYVQLVADPKPTQDQTVEKKQLCELVRQTACSLPHPQRYALQLRHQDEMSVKDAARLLGISEAAMKSQLSRGRATLTRELRRTLGISAPAMAADYCGRKKIAGLKEAQK